MAERHLTTIVKDLQATLDELAGADLHPVLDAELAEVLISLVAVGSRVEAATARVAAAVDTSKVWANDRSVSCPAWLARVANRDRSECARLVALGRSLRSMPAVETAFLAGELSTRHVRLLARAAERAPENFANDEAWLVGRARQLRFPAFVRVVRYWEQCAAPDQAEDDALARYRRRSLKLSGGMHGTGLLDVEFEPIGYATFAEGLRRIEQEMWTADWAEARDRLGEAATTTDLARSAAQRRYDALIEMARRSAATPADARTPAPLVTVLVDLPTLTGPVCELANGTVVTPGEVLPLLVEADIERAVFDPKGRVIDLGRRQRFFAGATRRAVEIRDRCCTADGWTVPAEQCDVDHVVPWSEGGRTDQDNGRLRCPRHHPGRRRRGQGGADSPSDDEDGPDPP